jgi:hypothetical protein
LNSANLLVSGTPTESGNSFSIAFDFSDSANDTLTLTNYPSIAGAGSGTIQVSTFANLGNYTLGSSYSNQLSACCASAYTWSLTGGALPPGISLSSSGLLSGTSSTAGTFTFLVQVADAANNANYAARQFTLVVTPITISTNYYLPYGNPNVPYSVALAATDGTGVLTWTLPQGNYLPPGLTLAPNGLISGTPTEPGQYSFMLTITDQGGDTDSTYFNISIYPPSAYAINSVSVSCSNSLVFANGSAQCAASVQGTGYFSNFVNWSASAGDISSSGLFEASSAVGPVTITATSAADPTQSASTTLMVTSGEPSQIVFDASIPLATLVKDQLGGNMSVQWDIETPASQASTLASLGVRFVRWPGGGTSDYYHWQTNTFSASTCNQLGQPPNSDDTFDNFMTQIAGAGNFDVAITLNYGSNPACTGPADPNEAAQWVAYAKSQGYQVKHWTVGNEVYNAANSAGAGEVDLHSPGAWDPATYASNVANQFYPLIKAQDPNAQVGVVVDAGLYTSNNWDSIVLANAKYDFVELHYYPENPGSENDAFLLTQAPANYAAAFSKLRAELTAAGHPNIPIYLGEYNSPNYNPGKQTISIVNALFIGMVQGEIMKAGVQSATIFETAFGPCFPIGSGNNASTLYGWQNFGSYDLIVRGCDINADGESADGIIPGTILPAGNAFSLSSIFGVAGNQVIASAVPSTLPNVRAYAATQGTGYALMLFNLDETNPVTVPVGPATATSTVYSGTVSTYSKAIYDLSQSYIWSGPTTSSLGNVTLPTTVTLPPWSMSVITLQ